MGKNSLSEKDLEIMGLVEGKDGSYSRPKPRLSGKMAERVQKIEEEKARYTGDPKEVVIDAPPTYYVIDNKRYYLTANAMLSHSHWLVRKKITTFAHKFLKPKMLHLKPLEPHSTIMVTFSVKRKITPTMNFDVDNKGYFWCKMFQDVLEDLKLVPKDNAYWISEVRYKFDYKRKEDNLTFKII